MIYYNNLEDIIFNKHNLINCDELIIVSGYIGPQPVRKLKKLPLDVTVIYGMYGASGIGKQLHKSLVEIQDKEKNINIFYSSIPVHAKIYIWKQHGKIVASLIGSANFSVSGLSNPYKETLAETSIDTFQPLSGYVDRIMQYCIKCEEVILGVEEDYQEEDVIDGVCEMSLLDRSGNVAAKSGLNWGLAEAHTSPGDAYIKISKKMVKQHPELFPPKLEKALEITKGARINRQNESIDLIWDDGTVMEGLLEGTQEYNEKKYPKQLCSGPVKSQLGKYIRKRLGIEDLNYQITKEDLEEYGRTTIEIRSAGEGIYELDFSVK